VLPTRYAHAKLFRKFYRKVQEISPEFAATPTLTPAPVLEVIVTHLRVTPKLAAMEPALKFFE
jgi:hypothetical protein